MLIGLVSLHIEQSIVVLKFTIGAPAVRLLTVSLLCFYRNKHDREICVTWLKVLDQDF